MTFRNLDTNIAQCRAIRIICRSAALVIMLGPLAARAQQPAPAEPRPTGWIPFRWHGDTIGGRYEAHAALYVPVTLEGVPGIYYLQLDTGAGWPRWYEVPMRQVLPRALRTAGRDTTPDEVIVRGRVGTESFASDTFLVTKGFGDSLPATGKTNALRIIGTLGLRFFRERLLVLDFPHQRFAIVSHGDALPASVPRSISYVPARYANGYFFLPLRIAGRAVQDFFFDTGASSFALVTTASTWRDFTGRTGSEPDNIRMSVSTWGKQVEDIGAPVAGSVEIGPVRVTRPLVFHQREVPGEPDFFARNRGLSGGLIGNALFADSNIVIIDLSRRRFGIAVTKP